MKRQFIAALKIKCVGAFVKKLQIALLVIPVTMKVVMWASLIRGNLSAIETFWHIKLTQNYNSSIIKV